MTMTLQQLQQLFPTALYWYFRVLNFRAAMSAFLEDPTRNPKLLHTGLLTPAYVAKRHRRLQKALAYEARTPETRQFLERRQQETNILNLYLDLVAAEQPSSKAVSLYRQNMDALYGSLDPHIFHGAMTYMADAAVRLKRQHLLSEVQAKVQWKPIQMYKPKPETFLRYRSQLQQIFPTAFNPISDGYQAELEMKKALADTGLAEKGWRVKLMPHGTGIAISAQRKAVTIGDGFHPRGDRRLQQVIAHEIYGHALRAEFGNKRVSADEEEGLAVVMEQLILQNFYYKRVLRYVALCLAWGVDGTPRDFKDTYAVLRPIAEIICGDPEDAQTIAFRECVRAFRGGNPAVPGAILTKDKVYLEGNLAVWQKLEENLLDEAKFKAVIQGHASILERNRYDK